MSRLFDNTMDYSKLCFGKPKKTPDGKYFIPVCYRESEEDAATQVMFQMSKVKVMTPVAKGEGEMNPAIDIHVSPTNPVMEIINDCDEQILGGVKDNKESWFPGKDMSDGYFDTAHMRSLKVVQKSKMQQFKVRTHKDIKCFDTNKKVHDIMAVTEDTDATVIVQLYGVWFTKTRFGATWRMHQMKVYAPKEPIADCMIEDSDDEDLDNVFPDE